MSYIKLYDRESIPDAAYLVNNGQIIHYINNHDKYILRGQNFIIGSTEIILTHLLGIPTNRLETLIVSDDAKVKKIPLETFLSSCNTFQFLMNISIVLAEQILLTNSILRQNQKLLTGKFQSMRDTAINYYKVLQAVIDEYNKRKLPWLKTFLKQYETSLLFKKGEIFARAVEPVRIMPNQALSNQEISIEKGTYICRQGEQGNEMFILLNGTIEVLVNDNKVATLNEQGTVIGEIALLLGETRSASLKAATRTEIYKLTKEDLLSVAVEDISIISTIAYSLVKKHFANIGTIDEINTRLFNKDIDIENKTAVDEAKSQQKAVSELQKLQHELSELLYVNKADYLKESFAQFLQ
jgi:CRP-like cAMP-binding protein